jgi:hypothetical protein
VSRGVRIVLAAAVAVILLGIGSFAVLLDMLGHRFYVATGTAVVRPTVVRHFGMPALICSGHGGPLETSGVHGAPLGRDLEQKPRVFCSAPRSPIALEYRESVYTSDFPRRMHVYVWLERHPELEGVCAEKAEPFVELEAGDLKGYGSPNPPEWPCFKPDVGGALDTRSCSRARYPTTMRRDKSSCAPPATCEPCCAPPNSGLQQTRCSLTLGRRS